MSGVDAGDTDSEIARSLGLARTTVRDMRRRMPPSGPRCLRCWWPTKPVVFTSGEYSELLGFYLGDGHITHTARTQRLRVALDARHPVMIEELKGLVARVLPENKISVCYVDSGATAVVSVYNTHLSCLLPQSGPGQKHRRALVFEPWQYQQIDAAPWSLLRGLVLSDGCAFINRTGKYRYLSYEFHSRSDDIRRLFTRACDAVGVHYRVNGFRVRICTRAAVREFAFHVGIKR